MKALLTVALFGAALYGCLRLGKYLANRKPKDWEPSNENEDQSNNFFV